MKDRSFVYLPDSSGRFPADIQAPIDAANVEPGEAPPEIARNTSRAFGLDPVDSIRLGETLAFLKKVGFITQEIEIKQQFDEYAMITIKFGQAPDPRKS
jgi:hypothetical protein